MSNNLYITKYDFENICRTCLSRKDLNPLYEECFSPTSLVDMLMSCTVVKVSLNLSMVHIFLLLSILVCRS